MTINKISPKYEKIIRSLGVNHSFKGFDAVIFSFWLGDYIQEAKIDIKKDVLDLYTIQTSSILKQQTVFTLLMDEILPLLGVKIPEKSLKNSMGLPKEYVKFALKIQKYLDHFVDIDDLLDNPTDITQPEYQATTNYKNGPMIKFEEFFDAFHNLYFE